MMGIKSSKSFLGTPISERVRRMHSNTKVSKFHRTQQNRLTDEESVQYRPKGSTGLIRNCREIDVVTVKLFDIVSERCLDRFDVAENQLSEALLIPAYLAMVTTLATRTKMREIMLSSRRMLRPIKTGPEGRLGKKGLRGSVAVMLCLESEERF